MFAMQRNSPAISDSLATFREYMRYERRRASGLSPEDWERWQILRKRLDGVFGTFESPDGFGRRATPRIPTSLVVRFENFGEMGSVLMTNLSRGGIFVPTEQPAMIGTELKLRIQVVSPHREIVLVGEVVSRNVGPAFEVRRRGMGICFKSLSQSDQDLVDELYEQQMERHLESD
jgi:Tfp pilus assembly protein PilZ